MLFAAVVRCCSPLLLSVANVWCCSWSPLLLCGGVDLARCVCIVMVVCCCCFGLCLFGRCGALLVSVFVAVVVVIGVVFHC